MAEHEPIKLTESAKKKLPAALAARKAREKGGLVTDIKRNINAKQTRLSEIMKSINLPTKPDKKKKKTNGTN